MTDSSALRRARFESLYHEHFGAVWAYARRRCTNPADADDVAAQTWAVVWRRLDAVPDAHELAWCYGVARRTVANHRRGEQRRLRLVSRVEAERELDPVREPDARSAAVLRALERLGPDDRELLRLVAWEQLSVTDIATVLDISANAASIRLHRARKRLAAKLGDEKPTDVKDLDDAGHKRDTAPITEGT